MGKSIIYQKLVYVFYVAKHLWNRYKLAYYKNLALTISPQEYV
jgi:hypothetical protein